MPGRLHPRVFNISPDSKVWEVFNAQKTHGFGQDVHYHPTGPGGEANLFCCDGWLMFGPPSKLWQPILTAHLVAVPVGLFCVYEGQYMPDWGIEEFKLSVLLPVVFMCISPISLFLTATKDPGVTLRSQDPAIVSQRASATGNDPQSTTTVSMDGFEVNLKHCRTCKVWRSPRSTHCDACDNCVEGFDHHCPWVGTCIGERNYFEFCWFIFSTSIVLIYCVGYSIYLIASDDGDVAHRTNKHWAAMICACYGFLFSIFIEILSACHCCLICQGVTTKEWYDLCPRGPCDSWPGALSQFLCFGMLCSVCLKFQEYELRPEEGRHDPCDKICRCKLRGENRPSCCASWFRVCCRPLPKRGWSMTDRWADVFPHKVEWNHRDDNADERVKLGWQKVERRLRYTKLTRAQIAKRIAAGEDVPMDVYDPGADPTLQVGGWVPKEADEAWSDDHFTPYPQDDWQMLKLHDKLPLTGIEADMLR